MNDLSHLGLGGQDKLKDDEDHAERMGVLTPLPLTDAALWERALDVWISECACRFRDGVIEQDCPAHEGIRLAFIALRDAAHEEGKARCVMCDGSLTVGEGWTGAQGFTACHDCVTAIQQPARAEQREASAGLIYDLAHKMAERGLFVRDDFGAPNIHAIQEIEAAIRAQEPK